MRAPAHLPLLFLLAACGAEPPEPRTARVPRDVFERLHDLEPWRQEDERGRSLGLVMRRVMEQEKTDRVWVTELGRPVGIHDLRPAPGATLRFDLRLSPWKRASDAALEVTVVGYPAEGDPRGWTRPVAVELVEGQRTVPFEFTFEPEGGPPIVNVAVGVEATGPVEEPEPRVVLVRPTLVEPTEVAPPAERPPQVIVVTLDTVRRDRLGAYGDPRAITPNLDAFAREAALFEDAFSVTNVTNPAHASLFTSLHLKDHKVRDNFTRLDPETPEMMAELARHGFATAAFTASFNFQPGRSDLAERFGESFGCETFHERRAEDVNADVLPWLARHHGRPFLAWVHYFDAHLPYDPPHPYGELFEPEERGTIELPLREEAANALYGESRDLGDFVARYRGEIAYLDAQFGELVRVLRELGIYDEAIVVVTSDHGECFGEQGVYCEHRSLVDAATAVPLLVRFPRGQHQGRYRGLASLLDVYPTVMDVLDLWIPHPVRGRSLHSVMEGEAPESLFAEHLGGVQASLRTGRWLGVLGLADERYFPDFAVEAGRFELYATEGPQERETERSAEQAETSAELRAGIEEHLEDALPFEAEPVDDERYAEMLERLGYVR